MQATIRLAQEGDLNTLKELTVLAFEPIFASFERILGATIFKLVYPDWHQLQESHVINFFNSEKSSLWVAEVDGIPCGLVAIQIRPEEDTGEIEFLVVHPDYQNSGIGTQLNQFAIEQIRDAGMKLAVVSTGGDESHAPARAAYEKVGFVGVPSVWYVKHLDD